MRYYKKHPLREVLSPWQVAREFVQNRELLVRFVVRNIELQYKGSALGVLWTLLSPLFLFAVYAFVFIGVFKGRFGVVSWETRADYAIGLFLSLSIMQFFQETILSAPQTIVANPNYVKKVVFPLEILPESVVGAALIRCLVSIGFVILAVLIWGPGLSIHSLWLPPVLFFLVLIALGFAWFLAALSVFLRDIGPIVQFLSALLMFTSAVFYSLQDVPKGFEILRFNPLAIVMELSRGAMLWQRAPSSSSLAILAVTAVVVFSAGRGFFFGLKMTFSDVL